VLDNGTYLSRKASQLSCSFKTIPNGLRQHPVPLAIFHSAAINALAEKPSDPSINYDGHVKSQKDLLTSVLVFGFWCFVFSLFYAYRFQRLSR
jgi:hypothetical protein